MDFHKIHAKLNPAGGFIQLYPPAKSSLNCFLTERLSTPEESETVTFSRLRLPICSINSQFFIRKTNAAVRDLNLFAVFFFPVCSIDFKNDS